MTQFQFWCLLLAIIIAGIAAIAVMVAAGQSTGGFGHDGGHGARAVSASTVPLPASGYEGAYSTSRVNAWGGLRDGGFGQSVGYGGHRPAHNPY